MPAGAFPSMSGAKGCKPCGRPGPTSPKGRLLAHRSEPILHLQIRHRLPGTGLAGGAHRTGAILEFFRLGAHEAAFEQAFAMSVERFELAFGEYRPEAAPPFKWRVQGAVYDSEGQPFEDVHANAGVQSGAVRCVDADPSRCGEGHVGSSCEGEPALVRVSRGKGPDRQLGLEPASMGRHGVSDLRTRPCSPWLGYVVDRPRDLVKERRVAQVVYQEALPG